MCEMVTWRKCEYLGGGGTLLQSGAVVLFKTHLINVMSKQPHEATYNNLGKINLPVFSSNIMDSDKCRSHKNMIIH